MARNYDGVNQYSSIASTNYQSATAAITLACWMRWDDPAGNYRAAVMDSSSGTFDTVWQIQAVGFLGVFQPRLTFSTSGEQSFQSADVSPSTDQWMFVAIRWQSSDGAWELLVTAEDGTVLDDTKSGTIASGESIGYTTASDIWLARHGTAYSDVSVGPLYVASRYLTDLEVADLRAGGSTALAVSDLIFAFDGDSTEQVQSASLTHFNSPTLVSGPGEGAGDVSVTVSAGESVRDGVDPSVELGDLSVAPTQGSSARTGVDPSVALGSLSITPDVGSSARTGINPSVDIVTGTPWTVGLTNSGITAVITKNFTTTEAVPAHFNMSAWDSTTISAPAKCLYIWTVSGGSEHDGEYNGPNLGLVFETVGTFDVDLIVIDGNGVNYGTASTTVTVAAKPTFDEEFYVDAVGGDDSTGDGSSGNPFQTMARALTELETNKASDLDRRILLTAGQTHTLTSKFTVSGYVGSFYIEKTGSGAKPIIGGTPTSTDDALAFLNGVGDAACRFRLCDLSVTAQTSSGNAILAFRANQSATSNPRGHDVVCVRVDVNSSSGQTPTTVYAINPALLSHDVNGNIENFGNAAYYDCDITSSAYATFAEWHKVSVFGGTWDSGNGPGGIGSTHVIRCTSSRDVSFRGVTVARPSSDRLCMKIHHDPGAQDNSTLVSAGIYSGRWTVEGCTFVSSSREVINFSPQDNLNPEEIVRYGVFSNNAVTLEGNTGYDLADSRFKRFVTIGASNVAVVNNRLVDHAPVEIDPAGDEPCTDIFIYNNSTYGDWQVGNTDEMIVRVNDAQASDRIEILNNAVVAVSGSGDLVMRIVGSVAGVDSDYNIANTFAWWGYDGSTFSNTLAAWQSAKSLDANSQVGDAAFADAANGDFTITDTSPAYSAGTSVPAAWKTYNGRRDPASFDIGAYAVDTIQTGAGTGVTATVSAGSSARTGVNPTASLGSLSIAAPAGSSTRTGVNPSIDFGSLSIAVAAGLSPRTGVNPIVQGGGSNVAALSATKSSIGVGVWL